MFNFIFSLLNPTKRQVIFKKKNPKIEKLRKEARLYLSNRLYELAEIYGFKYNKLRIKNAKTRWGSCSNLNNINLNMHLMKLPKHIIDYVILHELCHTKVKNHSHEFWNLMEFYMKDAKKRRKELRRLEKEIQIY